jgi:hypothetical protein
MRIEIAVLAPAEYRRSQDVEKGLNYVSKP